MSVPVFKDLDKSAADLIKKGFSTDFGFELEGGDSDGVKFKVTGTHTADALNSLFETTKTCKTYGLTLKAAAEARKNEPVYVLEATYEPEKVAGLKATFTSECSIPAAGEKNTNKLALLYKRGNLTVEDSFAYDSSKKAVTGTLAASFLARQSFIAGAQVLASFGLEEKSLALTGYGVKLGYTPSKAFSLVGFFDSAAGDKLSAGASLYYKKDQTEFAVQSTIDPKEATKIPAISAAISHAHDSKTTLKAKFSSSHSGAFSIKHQLTDALSVTLASECSGSCGKEESKASHKHGISVNLKL